ncbi:MAG: hypothetical protein U1D67_07030 [Dehalococcoidia bacterium]|nr:hypothetical protein [Dehalococcoidia bacterium]MDZ4246854.1 hypothetical protein [Dehalococcoidia bacterium]
MYKCGFCGAEFVTEQESAGHMMKHVSEFSQKQQDMMMRTYLLMAASQLTQICLISGKKPEDAMEVFARLFDLLAKWQGSGKGNDEFTKWLDQQWEK